MIVDCEHNRVVPEVMDQTIGVGCLDCDFALYVCWGAEHVPVSLWNRACAAPGFEDCAPVAEDHGQCAICGEPCAVGTTEETNHG